VRQVAVVAVSLTQLVLTARLAAAVERRTQGLKQEEKASILEVHILMPQDRVMMVDRASVFLLQHLTAVVVVALAQLAAQQRQDQAATAALVRCRILMERVCIGRAGAGAHTATPRQEATAGLVVAVEGAAAGQAAEVRSILEVVGQQAVGAVKTQEEVVVAQAFLAA
jgi:hypothetical protein